MEEVGERSKRMPESEDTGEHFAKWAPETEETESREHFDERTPETEETKVKQALQQAGARDGGDGVGRALR